MFSPISPMRLIRTRSPKRRSNCFTSEGMIRPWPSGRRSRKVLAWVSSKDQSTDRRSGRGGCFQTAMALMAAANSSTRMGLPSENCTGSGHCRVGERGGKCDTNCIAIANFLLPIEIASFNRK